MDFQPKFSLLDTIITSMLTETDHCLCNPRHRRIKALNTNDKVPGRNDIAQRFQASSFAYYECVLRVGF